MNSSSSSSSSCSSESSSSSHYAGEFSLRFSFEVSNPKTANCFTRHGGKIYAGLSSGGEVLSSSNMSKWEKAFEIGDESVQSMATWANGLFMGTSPGGMIWAKNFTTGALYEFVATRDQCVSSFAVWKDKLYAGTSPMGIVYSFDGKVWKEEYTAYGSGISSMTGGDVLYVFLKDAETFIRYDGTTWSVAPLSQMPGGEIETMASHRYVNAASGQPGKNPNPCASILSSTLDNGVVFGGEDGGVSRYSSGSVSRIFQTDSGKVTSIVNMGTNMNVAAIGNSIYLLDENTGGTQ